MILVLIGSPNKLGNTYTVVNELLKDIDEEIIYYDAYKSKIKACIDCKYCSSTSGCSIKDEMQDIYQLIEKVDTLIIASPLHFATFTGELINLLSRFQTYYAGKYVRLVNNPTIKKGLLVVTAGGHWPKMFVGVKETFNVVKLLFNIDKTLELLIAKCDEVLPTSSSEFKNRKQEIQLFLGEK